MIANRINLGLEENLKGINISFKTIYNYINNSIYGQELQQYMFSKMAKWSRKSKRKGKHIITNMVNISQRPNEANLRKEIGHFEFDTMGAIKSDKARVVGGIDRFSRKIYLQKVSRLNKSMKYGFKFIVHQVQGVIKSGTFDRGIENVNHKSLKINTYFYDAYSGRQKPSIEQGFLRLEDLLIKNLLYRIYLITSYINIKIFLIICLCNV